MKQASAKRAFIRSCTAVNLYPQLLNDKCMVFVIYCLLESAPRELHHVNDFELGISQTFTMKGAIALSTVFRLDEDIRAVVE